VQYSVGFSLPDTFTAELAMLDTGLGNRRTERPGQNRRALTAQSPITEAAASGSRGLSRYGTFRSDAPQGPVRRETARGQAREAELFGSAMAWSMIVWRR